MARDATSVSRTVHRPNGVMTAAAGRVTLDLDLVGHVRGEPHSYFADGDRAAGVFGVLAGFALLSGFVVFLAFEKLRHVAERRRGASDRGAPVRDGAVLPGRDA